MLVMIPKFQYIAFEKIIKFQKYLNFYHSKLDHLLLRNWQKKMWERLDKNDKKCKFYCFFSFIHCRTRGLIFNGSKTILLEIFWSIQTKNYHFFSKKKS